MIKKKVIVDRGMENVQKRKTNTKIKQNFQLNVLILIKLSATLS